MKSLMTAMISIALLATIGFAQEVVVKENLEKGLEKSLKVVGELRSVVTGQPFFPNRIVKNKPYSAEAVSESVQVLEDGNKITRSTTVKMYRDSEGRTRREGSGNSGNLSRFPSGGVGSFFGTIGLNSTSIHDPVSGFRYSLNDKKKTAYRYKLMPSFEGANIVTGKVVLPNVVEGINFKELSPEERARMKKDFAKLKENFAKTETKFTKLDKEFGNVVVMGSLANLSFKSAKSESLGTKIIEGITTEGTRTVRTIEAGAIGNELPIEITYEKWYSQDLELIVYSRKYDPRSGEQTYRLTNINQTEPDSSFFTVPSDYEIVKKKPFKFKK